MTYLRLPADAIDTPHPLCIRRLLETRRERRPDAVAIAAPGREALTYARLWEQVNEVVTALNERGVGRGDRVALVLPNGPELAVAFIAIAASAASAPLNPAYTAREFDFYLSDLNARALIVSSGSDSPVVAVAQARGIPILALSPVTQAPAGVFTLSGDVPPRPVRPGYAEPDDVALVLHTSGTTSRPKIVPLTHHNLCASAHQIRCALALAESDRCLNVMPLFHVHGLLGALLSSLAAGASVVCSPGFSALPFFEWLDEFQPTWYTAVPTIHQAILTAAVARPKTNGSRPLRFIRSCSAPLPPTVMAELERTFQVPVLEAYGMTEAAHQITSNPLPPRLRKPGSVGRAAGTEVKILDEAGRRLSPGASGEILIRGANVMHGYENSLAVNESAFTDGWLRTGDQGSLDEEGYLFITGRIKEIINRGGEKISPREVDEVLLDHPAIAQAVTFAVPHPTLGESVAAAVVLRTTSTTTPREIRDFAAARLADFKVPGSVLIVKEIPKGPTGKLQRIGLAEKLKVAAAHTGPDDANAPSTPPRTSLETVLAALWAPVLGLERVGVHDRFLQLGGDSILATQLLSRVQEALQVELPLPSLFDEVATIAAMAERIEQIRQEKPGPAALPAPATQRPLALAAGHPLPLSFAQLRLWFLHQLESENAAYNRPAPLRLTGPLHRAALERSLSEVMRRHEVLRTTFSSEQGRPIAVVTPAQPLSVPVIDLVGLLASEREAHALRLAREEARQPFDLAAGPVLRATLVRLDQEEHWLLLTLHHIAFDGWSMPVLIQELATLYEAFVSGQPAGLSEPPLQYSDFARWQGQWLQGEVMETQLSYWKEQLAGAPEVLDLPTDRPRSPVPTTNGARKLFLLPHGLSESLKALARQERATLFMTLLSAFQVLLSRYTGQEDLCVGTPIAGRSRPELEGLIGCFVNTLVMRADLRGDPSFRELLRRTRKAALAAYVHQDLPFEKLVEALRPERDLSYTPLVQVMFQLRNIPCPTPQVSDLKIEELVADTGMVRFPLSAEVAETSEGLSCLFQYDTDLFDAATMARMAGHFQTLLEGIGADPDQRISALPLLTPAERQQLLVEWNQTEAEYPRDRCVHQLFEEQVARTPEAVAVVCGEQRLTYRELNVRANQLAHYLRRRGVGPEARVAICVERSLDMMVGVLGILKAGGAYVPLDPAYPRERLAFIARDSQAFLLTQQPLLDTLPRGEGPVLCLDRDRVLIEKEAPANPEVLTGPGNLSHVIYTSGSTGQPKGVLGTHRGVVNYLTFLHRAFDLSGADIVLQLAPLSFDPSIRDTIGPLTTGAQVVLLPGEESRDPAAVLARIRAHGVTSILAVVPSHLRALVSTAMSRGLTCPSVRLIMAGGEPLTLSDCLGAAEIFGQDSLIVNQYGPTECTMVASYYPVTVSACRQAGVPIGRPIANTQIYLLDERLNPVPIGVAGELHIGGDGVTRGYLNQPELTAERFIFDPFSDAREEPIDAHAARQAGARWRASEAGWAARQWRPAPGRGRLYKTGDLARYRSDGNLEFLGRLDHQVKLRGFRIELGEIEAVLSQHPAIREAVLLAREISPGDPRLVAYLVPRHPELPSDTELRGFLHTRLPEYMLPATFVRLPALPLTPNGKVDRRALPAPEPTRPALDTPFLAPRGPAEEMLAGIWAELLGLKQVGIHDDFFALGGHSLLATQLISRLRESFRVVLPLRALFEAPTVASIAERIEIVRWTTQNHQENPCTIEEEREEGYL